METIKSSDYSSDIKYIRLDRPEKLNAMNEVMLEELIETTRRAGNEDKRVIVYEGTGRAFSTGMDLDMAKDEGNEPIELFHDVTRALRDFPGVTIGKMHGYAIGGGFEIPLSFDIRYAEEGTKFQIIESERGAPISNATTRLLPLIVGFGRARELVLTSRRIDASEAYDIGLVSKVFESDEFDDAVADIAEDLVENKSTTTLQIHKKGLNSAFPVEDVLEHERLLHVEYQSLDGQIDWE